MLEELESEIQYNLDGTPVQKEKVAEGDVTYGEVEKLITSIEMLSNLKYTIAKAGISKHDVVAFKDICKNAKFDSDDLIPALEAYPLGYYTEERSAINVNYGIESFGKALVSAIKSMFQKLIEMIRNVVRFIKRDMATEMTKMELESKTNALKKGKLLLAENIRQYGIPPDLNKRMGELAIKTLTEKFTVNTVLLSFFVDDSKTYIKLLLTMSKPYVDELVNIAKALSAVIDGNAAMAPTLVNLNNLKRLETHAKSATEAMIPQTLKKEELIRQYINKNNIRSENIFDAIDLTALSTYTPVEDAIDGFHTVIDVLEKANKKIQKYNPDTSKAQEEMYEINEFARLLSLHVNHVKIIMDFMINYNTLKKKLIGAIYNNDAMMASEIFKYARSNAVDDLIEDSLSKAFDALEKNYRVITN